MTESQTNHWRLARQICAVVFLALSLSTVWGLLFGWSAMTIERLLSVGSRRSRESIAVQPDGTALVATRSSSNYSQVTYRDVNDVKVELDDEEDFAYGARLQGPLGLDDSSIFQRWGPQRWQDRIVAVNDGKMGSYWYLVHNGERDNGRAELMGFDPLSRQPMDYIGNDGYQSTPISAQYRFSIDSRRFRGGATVNFDHEMGRIPR